MLLALLAAETTVDVTRLETRHPRDAREETKEYYDRSIYVIKKRRNIAVRRIVKIVNADVLEWVVELLEQLRECRNFSIASLSETSGTTLSLQIFDHKQLFFLHGEVRPGNTNVVIRMNNLAEQFSFYYNQLWQDAIKLKEDNRINWDNIIGFAERLQVAAKQRGETVEVKKLEALLSKVKSLSSMR
jgi:hypothetical protein